MEDILQTPEEP